MVVVRWSMVDIFGCCSLDVGRWSLVVARWSQEFILWSQELFVDLWSLTFNLV